MLRDREAARCAQFARSQVENRSFPMHAGRSNFQIALFWRATTGKLQASRACNFPVVFSAQLLLESACREGPKISLFEWSFCSILTCSKAERRIRSCVDPRRIAHVTSPRREVEGRLVSFAVRSGRWAQVGQPVGAAQGLDFEDLKSRKFEFDLVGVLSTLLLPQTRSAQLFRSHGGLEPMGTTALA